MNSQSFGEPVAVVVGLGFVRKIPSVMAAYQITAEWPGGVSRAVRQRTLMVCRGVLNGIGSVESAREAFIEFAEEAGILFDEADQGIAAFEPSLPLSIRV